MWTIIDVRQVDEENEMSALKVSSGPQVSAPSASVLSPLLPCVNAETGEPLLKPYQIYLLYAEGDNGLTYTVFCRLLDHLEIQLNSEYLYLTPGRKSRPVS